MKFAGHFAGSLGTQGTQTLGPQPQSYGIRICILLVPSDVCARLKSEKPQARIAANEMV